MGRSFLGGCERVGAYLETADEGVVDLVLEEGGALVVVAGPAPHVLAVAVGFAAVEDCGGDDPHDGAEDEEADCKGGVVDGGLFRLAMTSSPVAVEDGHADCERDARDDEKHDLWPGLLSCSPRW